MKWRYPICRKATDSETSADIPFCSERCKLLDLGNWSSEKSVISGSVLDESVPESPEPPNDRDEDERESR